MTESPPTKPARMTYTARRWLTGQELDARIRQDIAEIYAERGFVLATDLIRAGFTRAQVHAFQGSP